MSDPAPEYVETIEWEREHYLAALRDAARVIGKALIALNGPATGPPRCLHCNGLPDSEPHRDHYDRHGDATGPDHLFTRYPDLEYTAP